MAAPDLSFARATFAGLMGDTCRITRNVGGIEDDTLDPDTMALIPPETDPWYTGPCLISLSGGTSVGVASTQDLGTLSIPFDADADTEHQLRRGDVVECLTSGNPALVGGRWAVEEPSAGSFAVARTASISEGRR